MDTTFTSKVRLIQLKRHNDERGSLLPVEFEDLPFIPKRMFTITGMSAGTVRGEHGHHTGQQLLICLHGSIDIILRKDKDETHLTLIPDGPGLLIDSGIWCKQTYMTDKTVLLVLASEPYRADSYFNDWE